MKLRNKLILSCAALAAVATTAVSTTYAWYTSNQEVSATGITASTSSSSDALLLISKTGAQNTWSSNVDFTDHATVTLVPLYRDENGAFHRWNGDNNQEISTATTVATDYYSFSLYFKSGNGNPLTVGYKNFTLTNTSLANLPTKSVLTNIGLPTGATSSGTYTVDLLKALTMEIEYSNTVEVASGSAAHGTSTSKATYGFAGSSTADTIKSATVNAHQYYNDVKQLYTKTTDTALDSNKTYYTLTNGKYVVVSSPAVANIANYYEQTGIPTNYDGSPAKRGDTAARKQVADKTDFNNDFSATAFKIGGTTDAPDDTAILRVDYVIYLDGWDIHCFDACQSQTFTLDMEFQSTTLQ